MKYVWIIFCALIATGVVAAISIADAIPDRWKPILAICWFLTLIASYYVTTCARKRQGIDPPHWPDRLGLLEWVTVFLMLGAMCALLMPAVQSTSPHRRPAVEKAQTEEAGNGATRPEETNENNQTPVTETDGVAQQYSP